MSDKSPRQGMSKKSKSLKEKRADKRAKSQGDAGTDSLQSKKK